MNRTRYVQPKHDPFQTLTRTRATAHETEACKVVCLSFHYKYINHPWTCNLQPPVRVQSGCESVEVSHRPSKMSSDCRFETALRQTHPQTASCKAIVVFIMDQSTKKKPRKPQSEEQKKKKKEPDKKKRPDTSKHRTSFWGMASSERLGRVAVDIVSSLRLDELCLCNMTW